MKKLLAIAVVAVLIAFAGWRIAERLREVTAKQEVSDERLPVATMVVPAGTVVDALRLTGTIAPQTEVTVYSNVGGEVLQIHKSEGDRVKRDEIIARVKCTQPQLMVSQLEAAVAAAQSSLVTLESSFARAKALRARQAIADAQWEAAEAQYEAGRAQRDQLRVQLQMARSQRGDCSLRAPIDGKISTVHLEVGDLISGSQMTKSSPLATVIAVGQVKVELGVDERHVGGIHLGQAAHIYVDAYPDVPFLGEVAAIAPTIDAQTRTAKVDIRIQNSDGKLMPGMFARVRIERRRREAVPVVPVDALLITTGKPLAFVVKDGSVERRDVTTGIRDGDRIEIAAGIAVGERMVILGQQRLRDGAAVKEGVLPASARKAMGLDRWLDTKPAATPTLAAPAAAQAQRDPVTPSGPGAEDAEAEREVVR